MIKILTEFCRILIGATFIFSGIAKAIDPVGGAIKIGEYLVAFGFGHFTLIETILSFALASIEFTLGICLLLAVYRKLTTLCVLLMMCFMTPLTLYLAIFSPVSDCGCFGDAIIISNWATFFKNIPLLAGAVWVYIYHKRLMSFYSYQAYWFVVFFTFFFCIAFCYQNYTHLPIKDFMPYKVGLNIPKLMEIPDDAPHDEFLFIYEKEGIKKEFRLEDAPMDDASWKYVDSKLIKEGFIPVVSSFELYNKNEDNIAEVILTQPRLSFLLIFADIKEANDVHIDKINHVYDYAVAAEAKLPFYGISASSEEDIEAWKKNTGADYPFLKADDVLLKTMIRSNPGLIIIKNGTILAKLHYNDIPGEDKLEEMITKLDNTPIDVDNHTAPEIIAEKKYKERMSWMRIIAGFTLPLLLIWIYDFSRNQYIQRKKRLQIIN
ncbi:MAG: DoxX family protein [Tannerella sp.]|nr:DoxX family protein [Tannerella sp.]